MQDRYVGDVGDFSKFGLMRALAGMHDKKKKLRMGVLWYRFPDETHNNDGKHVGYLDDRPENRRRFRECDPFMWDTLKEMVHSGNRNLEAAERSGLFPDETIYHSTELDFYGMPSGKVRSLKREAWVKAGLKITAQADLVLSDSDNGLECKSVSSTSLKGPKYAFYDELKPIVNRGQSLVIYHHTSRRGKAVDQIRDRASVLRDQVAGGRKIQALKFHRGSVRAYFIIAQPEHENLLMERSNRMLTGAYAEHWERIC